MVSNQFDVIVSGVGSMGSAACYYLAKKGHRVLGIEQFTIPHELGSHSGQSRIIRKAYFEHPDYVPLLERAYQNWKQLEQDFGEQLFFRTGLLYFGQPSHPIMEGMKNSAALYHIPLRAMDREVRSKVYPNFSIPTGYETLLEPEAGFVRPERTISLLAKRAIELGADLHTGEKISGWKQEGDKLIVFTDKGEYRCNRLVLTAGPWMGQLVSQLSQHLHVTRQLVAWVKPDKPELYSPEVFPCWMIADEEMQGSFYGFPMLASDRFGQPEGLKLAHHFAGRSADPDQVEREPLEEELAEIMYALKKYLPGAGPELLSSRICLYTNSPDENFIIDHLPGCNGQVVVAAGFSGHGFKFVPAVGEILADLAMEGTTVLPIQFLRSSRFITSINHNSIG